MARRNGANSRKKSGRRHNAPGYRLIAIAAIFAIALGAGLFRYRDRLPSVLLPSGLFASAVAQRAVIEGAVRVDAAELLKRSSIVFPVTLEQLKNVHLAGMQSASPWIEKIKVVGIKNGAVVLCIVERKPIALLQTVQDLCLVDARGVCLPLGRRTGYDLPLLSGLADSASDDGVRRLTQESTSRMNRFFRESRDADASFSKMISQAGFGSADDCLVRVMLAGSAGVLVMNENAVAEGIQKYAGLRSAMAGDSLKPARIDLAYRNLAFVTPEPIPQTTTAGGSTTKKLKV